MGRRIVAGCSKTTKDGVSLHKFPVDTKVRRQWITQVKKNRANWREPSSRRTEQTGGNQVPTQKCAVITLQGTALNLLETLEYK